MAFHQAMSWHEGEEKMHAMTKVSVRDNPMNPGLSPRAAQQIQMYPLMAIGTTDPSNDNRPWTTLWGGEAPISQPIAPGGIIGIKATVDATFDPVAETLLGRSNAGEAVKKPLDQGAMVSALSINLETRSRVKLFGRMVVGAMDVRADTDGADNKRGNPGDVQLVLKIEQSLGNCPKYLNKRTIASYPSIKPRLVSEDVVLSEQAIDLVHKTDLFFISSSHKFEDMDTNHRGGPPGFVRVRQPDETSEFQSSVLVWPEYSGNNLYQTLGNLMTTPRAGIVIPDFETGNVLYLTGDTEVLVNEKANEILPKSKLAVQFTIRGSRYVEDGLGFRGQRVQDGPTHGLSPYNPKVRFLRSEKEAGFTKEQNEATGVTPVQAKMVKKKHLSPTLTKYRFSMSDPSVYGPWKPGQYVAFDFSEELNIGYSHMRDDDPTSLNDDFIRTFTVASPPRSLGIHGEEFEVIIRKVGSVTSWLSWQREGSIEAGVLGFGGQFRFSDIGDDEKSSSQQGINQGKSHKEEQTRRKVFVAQGIGITPLLGQVGAVQNFKVRWTISIKDIGAVVDVITSCSDEVRANMVIYLTGAEEDVHEDYKKHLSQIVAVGGDDTDDGDRNVGDTSHTRRYQMMSVQIEKRRMNKEDLTGLLSETDDWYMCAAPAMRTIIQGWIPEKSIVFENFDY